MTLAAGLLTGGMAYADIPPMSDWAFSQEERTIGDYRYYLDETNKIAELRVYFSSEQSKRDDTSIELPSAVDYNGTTYTVVSMSVGSWYSGYELKNVTSVKLPAELRRMGNNALYPFVSVHEFVLPDKLESMGEYIVNSENRVLRFTNPKAPVVAGRLSSNSRLKVYVPAASFQEYKLVDFLEDCCVVSDDLSKNTFHTGQVDSGELGYVVVANQLPNIVVYSDVNKLVIDKGTIDATDWYQLRQMKNLIELDITGLSISDIPREAMSECWQLEHIYFTDSLRTIHEYAFQSTGIKELVLPKKFSTLDGYRIFYNCDSLRHIALPDSIKMLPEDCFEDCNNLKNVMLPSYLAEMKSECFYACDIDSIYIPGTLAVLPYRAFRDNRNMSMVTFGEGVEEIGSEAFHNNAILRLEFPASVRRIKDNAFSYNRQLADLYLNEGLEEITYRAFACCSSLTEVRLPSSLQFCLDRPFSDCDSLQSIYTYALIPPTVRGNVPTSEARNINLFVPLWSFQEYMTTPGWLEYQDHTSIDPNILPQNIVINKDFEFVLTEQQNTAGYEPNIRLLYNTERIDDGFGHQKTERGNLTISSRSKLAVGDFSMFVAPYAKFYSDLSRFYNNRGYNYDAELNKYNPNALIVKGEMRAANQTYHLLLCNDRWQFVSFPFDVAMSDFTPDDALTQWVVRRYSGADRAEQKFENTWHNLTAKDTLKAGKGYVVKCYNSDSKYYNNYWSYNAPVEFTLKPIDASLNRQRLFNSKDCKVALEEFTSEFEQNRSWNLIGNPYPCYFDTRYLDTDAPFLVWNSWDNTYAAFSPVDDDYILEPGEAFFIQRPVVDGQELTFLAGGRQTYRNPNDLTVKARSTEMQAERTVLNLVLTSGDHADRTRVVFNESALMKYEAGRDAAKFMSENMLVPQLWTVGGSVSYAINERPLAGGTVEVAMRLATAGSHTLALDGSFSQGSVMLEDRLNGTTVDLTADAYTFQAEAGTLKGRFFLTGSEATGIKAAGNAAETAVGNCFNLQGQRVGQNRRGIVIKNGKKTFNK
jgi:hypothetical protein